jgi:hypothetical protein
VNAPRTIIALLFLLALQSFGEPVRVGIARLDFTAANSHDASAAEAERRQLRDLASALERSDFDLIILPEVKNRQACNALAKLLKPSTYQIAICSNFRSPANNAPVRQIAILSKTAPIATWSEEWRGPAQVDLAGGFGFGAFRCGTNVVGLFALRLEDSDGPEAVTSVGRQYEAAGRYVMHHVNWVESRVTNGTAGFVIIGDDPALSTFEQGGFRGALEGPARRKKQGDGLLIRNARLTKTEFAARRTSGYALIKAELHIQGSASSGSGWNSPNISSLIARTRAHVSNLRESLSWVIGIGLGSVFVAAGLWGLLQRRRAATPPIAPGLQNAFVVEIDPSKGSRHSMAVGGGTTATGSVPPGRRDAQVELWQKRAFAAEERGKQCQTRVQA